MADRTSIFSHLPHAAHALVLAELWQKNRRSILHIAVNDREMEQIVQELSFFAPDARVLTFPAWDVMPYDRISPKTPIMATRMQTLAQMRQGLSHDIVITTIASALQKLPPASVLGTLGVNVAIGQSITIDALVAALAHQGYARVGKAMEPGEFAVRGSILDVIPAGSTEGIRLDWFGDQVESIKLFDPMQQTSAGTLPSFSLTPTSEVLLSDDTISRFRTRYRELFGAIKDDPLYEAISQGAHYPGMEHFLPLFYEQTATIFDYANDALITFDDEAHKAASERHETIADYYQARVEADKHDKKSAFSAGVKYHPLPPDQLYLSETQWDILLHTRTACRFTQYTPSPLEGEGRGEGYLPHTQPSQSVVASPHPNPLPQGERELVVDLGIRPLFAFTQGQADNTPYDQLREQLIRAREQKKTLAIACMSEGSRERLFGLLMEREFHPVMANNFGELQKISGKSIALIILPAEHGFETPALLLFSEADVLGERIGRTTRKKKTSEAFFAEAASFNEGELVVHKEHGIARFAGLVAVEVQGAKHDCLKLMYDGDDKLFLPVENIELITRYGEEDEGAKLDKLGGASWQARKAKLKKRITIAAEALLKIAAERQMKKAATYEVTTGTYDEFVARFGYAETDDQARAIAEVVEDLQAGKPMDRLVCGDVGFGKTEVALRAAFVAASAGSQVALICPTTLLARQHYNNFKARFAGFPLKVCQLSRMVTAKQQKDNLAAIKSGEMDIVIGTHALLAKGVEFKNLGLLIVDEEQHFGVAQKEKLKSMKSDVHVLTLSATPIPRTLQMALTGVRDLSLITTPPIDRLAIRSFVMPFDPVTIREAVMRELHRGGRCFIVTPRIKDIAELRMKLTEIAPEAKICIAHGGMSPTDLDKTMNAFYDGEYNVLLSTAIIESGLDIPTANTMIVHNAHLFGLSQLYQMRGRVGRSKVRAYAYFMLPHKRELTKNAARRLEIMQTLDTLGAGFTLANHDMDIRGFGNLVGEEQSGHIREVGIELYQQMLEEAVAALRAETPETVTTTDFTPTINLGLSVLIPETYVNDLSLRMGLYKRAANLQDAEEVESFAAELIDRFGAMPSETRALIDIISLKILCKKAGIERIDVGPKGAVISLFANQFVKPDALIAHVNRHVTTLKIRPDQKIVFSKEWSEKDDKVMALKKLVGEIGKLAAS